MNDRDFTKEFLDLLKEKKKEGKLPIPTIFKNETVQQSLIQEIFGITNSSR